MHCSAQLWELFVAFGEAPEKWNWMNGMREGRCDEFAGLALSKYEHVSYLAAVLNVYVTLKRMKGSNTVQ